jgi:hypothetical protein
MQFPFVMAKTTPTNLVLQLNLFCFSTVIALLIRAMLAD